MGYYNYQVSLPTVVVVLETTTLLLPLLPFTTITTTRSLNRPLLSSWLYMTYIPAVYKYKEITITESNVNVGWNYSHPLPPPNTYLILLIIILSSLALNSAHILLLITTVLEEAGMFLWGEVWWFDIPATGPDMKKVSRQESRLLFFA